MGQFFYFRTDCAILTSYIHARVVVSRVDVVTLRDQILRIASFSYGLFTAMARNKEPGLFYVLLCSWLMEGAFSGSKISLISRCERIISARFSCTRKLLRLFGREKVM